MNVKIEFTPFELDLSEPWKMARGTTRKRSGFILEITGENGVTGFGEAAPLDGWTESFEDCESALQELSTVDRRAELNEYLQSLEHCPAARHGLFLALVDLQAKEDGRPLYQFLGRGKEVKQVPVNATVGDESPEDTMEAVRRYEEDGFDCVKIKVAGRTLPRDLNRLEALNECPRIPELRLDANGAWSFEEAREFIQKLDWYPVDYVEQPLDPEELKANQKLRTYGRIALDESLLEFDSETVLQAKACNVAVLKPMAHGGLDRVLSLARTYQSAGVQPIVSTTIDSVVARTGAVHLAAALGIERPCGLATGSWIKNDLADDPAPVQNGTIKVPQGNGLGIDSLDVPE